MKDTQSWEDAHFGKFGIDLTKESICFYIEGDHTVYEIDDKSILYEGTQEHQYRAGELLLVFANMRVDSGQEISELLDNVKKKFPEKGIEQFQALYKAFRKLFDPIVSIAMTHQYFGSDKEKDFWLFLDTATTRCRKYVDEGILWFNSGARFDATLVQLDKDGRTFNRMYYCTYGFSDLISFDVYRAFEKQVLFKRCKLCGKAFLPVARSDELYCQNIYRGTRTCSDVAFEMLSKQNPFYFAYRSAYKAMHARMKRMGSTEYWESRLRSWKIEARSKQIEFESKGDLEGFKQWLEDSKKTKTVLGAHNTKDGHKGSKL